MTKYKCNCFITRNNRINYIIINLFAKNRKEAEEKTTSWLFLKNKLQQDDELIISPLTEKEHDLYTEYEIKKRID